MKNLKHWSLTIDELQLAQLVLDVTGHSVNILTREVILEMEKVISHIAQDGAVKGLVLRSGKKGGFVYGADIHEFGLLKNEEEVREMMAPAHRLLWQIQEMNIPTICCIDGVAVGGGLEIPLAFDHIIITSSPKTMLGFPEVNLGIMPGYGGTGRAVARIGLARTLDMVFTGKPLKAQQAYEAGLATMMVASDADFDEAIKSCLDKEVQRHSAPDTQTLNTVLQEVETRYLSTARADHTPALFWIYEHFKTHLGNPEALTRGEAELFPKMMMSEASHHLRHVFAMTDKVKKSARGDAGIHSVHVIGAGTMGGDIAAVAAMRGYQVSLSDMNEQAIDAALERAYALFDKRSPSPDEARARLVSDPKGNGIAQADIIIEAVAENIDIKHAVFSAVEAQAKPDAILATNTSSIMIEDIARSLKKPERLIGLHFFNPVPVMPLVEVISGRQSDADFINRAMYFSGHLGKMPVAVASVKGFLVNRALLPYLFRAIEVMEAGEQPDKIDQALLDFGMPMGPIELCDQIGLDVCYDVGLVLGMPEAAENRLKQLIDAGQKGRKTQHGFYAWEGKKALRPRAEYDTEQMQAMAQDILAPLIEKCRSAVKEQIVSSTEDADIGCILGIGFPRFRGGPLSWADYPRKH